jgi:hypothetical protein
MPSVDRQALLLEDDQERAEGLPYRFGAPFEVNYSMDNSGAWTILPDGGRLWRLRLSCPGAYSTNLIYNRFVLPEGATFFVYDDDREYVLGSFTQSNNKSHQMFATAPIPGESCILEYFEPAGVRQTGEITVGRVIHGYKDIFSIAKDALDFGESGACNINVNCPEGESWADQKQAVAMIITYLGNRLCSGVMVNNARQDMTPYFLTAEHCLGSEETWTFMFGYESPNCEDIEGPISMTASGATRLAADDNSDFGLVKLEEEPPESYNVYFAGWSAVDVPADSSVCIHHPSGDIKKISFDNDPVESTDYLGGPASGDTHWRVGQWEAGTTEGGSSGGPLFDYNHRIVGQLHGGHASCDNMTSDWHGKFSQSWSQGLAADERLRDWLDPDSTGILVLDGRNNTGLTVYHAQPTDTATIDETYEVRAFITSDCEFQPESLVVRYRVQHTVYRLTLNPTSQPGEYMAYIPIQAPGTEVRYHISARDECGRSATTGWYTYEIVSGCVALTPPFETRSGGTASTVEYSLQIANACGSDYNFTVYRAGNNWPTTLWNDSGTSPLPPSVFVRDGEAKMFLTRVEVPSGSFGEYDTAQVIVSAIEDETSWTFAVLKTVLHGGPDITVFPDFVAKSVTVGSSAETGFIIGNNGIADLTYTLSVENGEEWLVIKSALAGTIVAGHEDTIVCEMSALSLDTGAYHANVVIDNNDPGIGDNPYRVPVQLRVRLWICGDLNGTGKITLSDVTRLIDFVYISKNPLPYHEAGNVDGSPDGKITLSDIIHLVAFVYQDGDPLACDGSE